MLKNYRKGEKKKGDIRVDKFGNKCQNKYMVGISGYTLKYFTYDKQEKYMDFKTLKANSGKNLSKLTDELNKVSGATKIGRAHV